MTKVSLVIPTLDAESDIEGLLNRIYRQTRRPDEVIVVDSCSSDRTVDIVKSFEWVRLISIDRSEFDHGLTRDMALRESSGDIVCFMTQDAVPADDSISRTLLLPFLLMTAWRFHPGASSPRTMRAGSSGLFVSSITDLNPTFGPRLTSRPWGLRRISPPTCARRTAAARTSSSVVSGRRT